MLQRSHAFPSMCRVVMSVNDKWHYCHNSDVLVGSRAMRDRHLQLLGYVILQVGQLQAPLPQGHCTPAYPIFGQSMHF